MDGDGDLDLAAVGDDLVRVYTNDGAALSDMATFEAQTDGVPRRVAWGDWDGDGDVDLAAARGTAQPAVFVNDAGAFSSSPGWVGLDAIGSNDADWGDFDGDGDLDLAVGVGSGPDLVYESSGSELAALSAWSSVDAGTTRDIEWVDWDGDGDLDLFATREAGPSAVYVNDSGALAEAPRLIPSAADGEGAAFGDFDEDGDLDLALGVAGSEPMQVLTSRRADATSHLPQNSTRVTLDWLGTASRCPDCGFGPAPLVGASLPVSFTLVDAESDPVAGGSLWYSPRAGGAWCPAAVSGDTIGLAASPGGTLHDLLWDVAADGVASDSLLLRLVVDRQTNASTAYPTQHGAVSVTSEPLRVYAVCFPLDADGDGAPCEGDCDDLDPDAHPGALEVCDGVDQDCDGATDEGFDADGDGSFDADDPGCAAAYPTVDCDDGDPAVHPNGVEVCDGVDQDCDAEVDEGFDADGDGWTACGGDCDDGDAANFPGNAELCDGQDNDCDSETDEIADVDDDGYSICAGDCDDFSDVIHPGGRRALQRR